MTMTRVPQETRGGGFRGKVQNCPCLHPRTVSRSGVVDRTMVVTRALFRGSGTLYIRRDQFRRVVGAYDPTRHLGDRLGTGAVCVPDRFTELPGLALLLAYRLVLGGRRVLRHLAEPVRLPVRWVHRFVSVYRVHPDGFMGALDIRCETPATRTGCDPNLEFAAVRLAHRGPGGERLVLSAIQQFADALFWSIVVILGSFTLVFIYAWATNGIEWFGKRVWRQVQVLSELRRPEPLHPCPNCAAGDFCFDPDKCGSVLKYNARMARRRELLGEPIGLFDGIGLVPPWGVG